MVEMGAQARAPLALGIAVLHMFACGQGGVPAEPETVRAAPDGEGDTTPRVQGDEEDVVEDTSVSPADIPEVEVAGPGDITDGTDVEVTGPEDIIDSTDVEVAGACTEGDQQTLACGLNDAGTQEQTCVDAQWAAPTPCDDTDVCVNGQTQEGSTTCGLNGEGVLMQDCTDGQWVDGETCTGTDVCVNGQTQEGSTTCGLNGEGVLMQDCTDGQWVDDETCTGTDGCVNGSQQSLSCGVDALGSQVQDCEEGQWTTPGPCGGPSCDALTPTALMDDNGSLLPLVDGFAWQLSSGDLSRLDSQGNATWTAGVPDGALFGGFDFDADGVTDAALVQSEPTGQICGSTPTKQTWVTFVRGSDGSQVSGVSPTPDICWDFGTAIYPTSQWTDLGILFGTVGGLVALSPYYATTSWLFSWSEGWTSEALYYPSTASYDLTYTADKPNAWGTGTSFLTNAHVANGLITQVSGEERLVFFTSGRLVQYRIGPLGPDQLAYDSPFLTGGRTDIAGRNYGLVTLDPNEPQHLVLVGGTDAQTVFADRLAGEAVNDPWGQIERHISRVDLPSGLVEDRFFSYAHDNNDGDQYEGRVVYPAGIWAGGSQMAFNVFGDGEWVLHVTTPGKTSTAWSIPGVFLWDIQDLDGDGLDEWLMSPTNGYLPQWHTDIYHRQGDSLITWSTHEGVIPYLVGRFREPTRTTSRSLLYPVSTTKDACVLYWMAWHEEQGPIPLPL